jgi:hypothetical protein
MVALLRSPVDVVAPHGLAPVRTLMLTLMPSLLLLFVSFCQTPPNTVVATVPRAMVADEYRGCCYFCVRSWVSFYCPPSGCFSIVHRFSVCLFLAGRRLTLLSLPFMPHAPWSEGDCCCCCLCLFLGLLVLSTYGLLLCVHL